MNKNNLAIHKEYKQHLFENTKLIGKIFKVIKNIAKLLLQRRTQNWPFLVHRTPSDPNKVIDYCLKYKGSSVKVYSWLKDVLEEIPYLEGCQYEDHCRIVICCKL